MEEEKHMPGSESRTPGTSSMWGPQSLLSRTALHLVLPTSPPLHIPTRHRTPCTPQPSKFKRKDLPDHNSPTRFTRLPARHTPPSRPSTWSRTNSVLGGGMLFHDITLPPDRDTKAQKPATHRTGPISPSIIHRQPLCVLLSSKRGKSCSGLIAMLFFSAHGQSPWN